MSASVAGAAVKEISAREGQRGEHNFVNSKPSAKKGRFQLLRVESEQNTSKDKMRGNL